MIYNSTIIDNPPDPVPGTELGRSNVSMEKYYKPKRKIHMIKHKDFTFMMISAFLCAALFGVKVTGTAVHTLIGLLLGILSTVHLFAKWKKYRFMPVNIRRIDQILILSYLFILISGIISHLTAGMLLFKIIHKLSSLVFCIGLIGHVIQHKKYLIKA